MARFKVLFHYLPISENKPFTIKYNSPQELVSILEDNFNIYISIAEAEVIKFNYHICIDPFIRLEYEQDALLIANTYNNLKISFDNAFNDSIF